MKKQLALIYLLIISYGSSLSQSVYISEGANSRISRANMGPTNMNGRVQFGPAVTNPYRIVVAQQTSKLYYLRTTGELIRANLGTGAIESIVINQGAMAEFADISFYRDDDAIFAANSPEVYGIQYVPSNNNDGGNDVQVDLGPQTNDIITNLEVDNDAGIIYFSDPDALSLFEMQIGSGNPQVLVTLPTPTVMSLDMTNNDLYFVVDNGSSFRLHKYDLDLNVLSPELANLGSTDVNDISVYPGFNKVYFSLYNTGIFSVPLTGGSSTLELSLAGAGSIYFDIQDDLSAPAFTTLSPVDGATDVDPNQQFDITFDQNIFVATASGTSAETGIRLMRVSDNAQIEILDRSSANISITGSTASFSFNTNLTNSEQYYILIGNKVFRDPSNNNFIGISISTGWDFSTQPGVTSNNPTAIACVGTFKNYPNIVITESANSNFQSGAGTLIFGFSSGGYSFENTIGSVTAGAGNVTITSFAITNTTITINYTASGGGQIDVITISGLKMKSTLATNPATTVIRTGGTGVVEGLVNNTVIATVTTQDQPVPPGVAPLSASMCLNSNASAVSFTGTGTQLRWLTANDLFGTSFITALNNLTTVTAQDLGISTATSGTISRFVRQNVGGCISLATQIDITVVDPPANILTTTVNQTSCGTPNGSASVTGVDGGGTSGYDFSWFDMATNPIGGPSPVLTNVPAGTYTAIVTNQSTGCSAQATVTVNSAEQFPSISLLPTPNTSCATPNGQLDLTIGAGTGPVSAHTITWYNGPDNTSPVNPSSTGVILSNLAAGTYTVRVEHNTTECASEQLSNINDNLVFPVASPPSGEVCESTPGSGTANVDLTTYNATLTGGDANVSVTWRDPSLNVVTSAVVADNDIYLWTLQNISNGCEATGELTFTVDAAPTTSDAGLTQNVCGASTSLAANTPLSGTGTWSIVSGIGGSIASPNSATSTFLGTSGSTYLLEWSIAAAGVCPVSTSQVTINFGTPTTTSAAGADQEVCAASATLAANPPLTGTGMWSVANGTGGSFANTTSPTSGFTGTRGNVYTLRWTITGACSQTTDDVTIILASSPSVSNAGTNQNICGTSTTLAANAPSTGAGLWSVVTGGGGLISDTASPTSSFTGLAGVTYSLRWTISNSVCTASSDDVQIIMSATPSVANAGTDKNICGNSAPLSGNSPVVGTGLWSILSGSGGSFADPASATTTFTGNTGTTYSLRWTISNSPCTSSTDDVSVVLVASPTIASAGADQTKCDITTILTGNTPGTGTGSWSIISGAGGTITTPSSPTSVFSGNPDVTYTLRWTVSNGVCNPSTDDVTISLTNPISAAVAGPDKTQCGTSTAMAGNAPSSGTGQWSVVNGAGGGFVSASNPTTSFNGIAGNTYTLRWTISKIGCTPSSDDVTILLKTTPQGNGSITPSDNLCIDESVNLTVTGFTNVNQYKWDVPEDFGFISSTGPSIEITAQSGDGDIIQVIPQNECGDGAAASVEITILPLPSIEINLPPTTFVNEVVSFSFTSDGSIQSSAWSLGDGTNSTEPSVEHSYALPGNYEIGLVITSDNGCINTASTTYTVSDEPLLTDRAIKNVITANGDDKNNILYIENLDRYPDNEVRFLDRWGVEIFSKTNYQNDWEAKAKDGQFLPAGQYICIVKLLSSGKVITRTVSIIKGR